MPTQKITAINNWMAELKNAHTEFLEKQKIKSQRLRQLSAKNLKKSLDILDISLSGLPDKGEVTLDGIRFKYITEENGVHRLSISVGGQVRIFEVSPRDNQQLQQAFLYTVIEELRTPLPEPVGAQHDAPNDDKEPEKQPTTEEQFLKFLKQLVNERRGQS